MHVLLSAVATSLDNCSITTTQMEVSRGWTNWLDTVYPPGLFSDRSNSVQDENEVSSRCRYFFFFRQHKVSHSLFYTDSSVTRSKNKLNENPLLFDNSFNILENTLFWASTPAESGLTYRVRCQRYIIKHENTTLQIPDISEYINHKLSDGTAKPDMGRKMKLFNLHKKHGVCCHVWIVVSPGFELDDWI